MICIEYIYYFQKRLTSFLGVVGNGIQVVPFLFKFNETIIPDNVLDLNSIFRFILYPNELINEDINFYFIALSRNDYLQISQDFSFRADVSKETIFKTTDSGSNNLNLNQSDIDYMKDCYNHIISEEDFDLSLATKDWIKHTILYWKYLFWPNEHEKITINDHYEINYTDNLSNSILYISLYEQIYYLQNKFISELP